MKILALILCTNCAHGILLKRIMPNFNAEYTTVKDVQLLNLLGIDQQFVQYCNIYLTHTREMAGLKSCYALLNAALMVNFFIIHM